MTCRHISVTWFITVAVSLHFYKAEKTQAWSSCIRSCTNTAGLWRTLNYYDRQRSDNRNVLAKYKECIALAVLVMAYIFCCKTPPNTCILPFLFLEIRSLQCFTRIKHIVKLHDVVSRTSSSSVYISTQILPSKEKWEVLGYPMKKLSQIDTL